MKYVIKIKGLRNLHWNLYQPLPLFPANISLTL